MKKTLLTLATVAISTGSMAATIKQLDAKNVSVTATPTNMLRNIVKDTSLSLATGFERKNVDVDTTAGYLNFSATKQFNEKLSITAQLRSDTDDVNTVDGATPYKMIDPRIFINAYNTEFNSNIGKITLSPSLRIQPHTKGDAEGNIATLRLGATTTLATTAANTVALSVFGYDNITDSTATSEARDESHFYFVANNTYQLNDTNSISGTFEYFTNIDQAENIYRSVDAQDDVTLTYSNTAIKSLNISPYVSQDLSNNVVALNMLELGLDLSYSF